MFSELLLFAETWSRAKDLIKRWEKAKDV